MRSLLNCPCFLYENQLILNMLRWSFCPCSSWPPCRASAVRTCVSYLCCWTCLCLYFHYILLVSWLMVSYTLCFWCRRECFCPFDLLCKCHKHQLYECIVFVGQFGGRGRMYTMHFQSTARHPPPSSFIRLLPLFCCEVVYLLLDLLQTLCGF